MKSFEEIAEAYFSSRPNLSLTRDQLGVFFIACPGSGKSTLRQKLVDEYGATYVCNDEVRVLLAENGRDDSWVYQVVDLTWRRIMGESNNHLIVFDSDVSRSYVQNRGYLRNMESEGIATFVIEIDLRPEILTQRITSRSRPDSEQLLAKIDEYYKDWLRVKTVLTPDFVLSDQTSTDELLRSFEAKLATLS